MNVSSSFFLNMPFRNCNISIDYLCMLLVKVNLITSIQLFFSFDMSIWVDAVWLGPNWLRDCKETL